MAQRMEMKGMVVDVVKGVNVDNFQLVIIMSITTKISIKKIISTDKNNIFCKNNNNYQ